MYKAWFVGAALLAFARPAQATWSVVGVDPVTREVGVAVATCVPEPSGSRILPEVAGVAPGIGALAAQAQFNQQTRDRALTLLRAGTEPQAVLDQVNASDPGAAQRQYGVVTLTGGAANHTGSQNLDWAGALKNRVATVQGNILVGREVVDDALRAFELTEPCEDTLADKLMRALEAGRARGGDGRCSPEQGALVAVLRVAAPGEDGDDPALNLVVTSPAGSTSPVALLKQAYDRYRAQNPARACTTVDAGRPVERDAGSALPDASGAESDAQVVGPGARDASASAGNLADAGRDGASARDAASLDAASTGSPRPTADARVPASDAEVNEDEEDDDAAGPDSVPRRKGGGCSLSQRDFEGSAWSELGLLLLFGIAAWRRRRERRIQTPRRSEERNA